VGYHSFYPLNIVVYYSKQIFIIFKQTKRNALKRENIHNAKEVKVNQNYFTGNVTLREVLGQMNSAEQEMYHVTFRNGALTTLHYHESDQILIATKGKGVVGLIKEGMRVTKFEIGDTDITFFESEGDTICIPSNKLHFHGAIRGENFSHIAIRKMYKMDNTAETIKRAENKWEYDLISEETGNNDPQEIKKIATEIAKKVQIAISKKLENIKQE
jgi:quercetin dioxygenase-like cupin family protein